jgi:hypothetical protein
MKGTESPSLMTEKSQRPQIWRSSRRNAYRILMRKYLNTRQIWRQKRYDIILKRQKEVKLCIILDWIGLDWAELDWTELDWAELDWIALGWIGLDWTELGWIGLGWIGLDWTRLNWIGLNWIWLNWIGLDWAELDWFRIRFGCGTSYWMSGFITRELHNSFLIYCLLTPLCGILN